MSGLQACFAMSYAHEFQTNCNSFGCESKRSLFFHMVWSIVYWSQEVWNDTVLLLKSRFIIRARIQYPEPILKWFLCNSMITIHRTSLSLQCWNEKSFFVSFSSSCGTSPKISANLVIKDIFLSVTHHCIHLFVRFAFFRCNQNLYDYQIKSHLLCGKRLIIELWIFSMCSLHTSFWLSNRLIEGKSLCA